MPGGDFNPLVEYKERTPDHPYNCLYVPKRKQGRELKVNSTKKIAILNYITRRIKTTWAIVGKSNGDSHPQFQESHPVRLKRGTEGVRETYSQ